MEPILLTTDELAKKLRITPPTLRKALKSKGIKGYRVGRAVRYDLIKTMAKFEETVPQEP